MINKSSFDFKRKTIIFNVDLKLYCSFYTYVEKRSWNVLKLEYSDNVIILAHFILLQNLFCSD